MRYAPPLLLDAMLGRLARWLRMLGYDAAYLQGTDDLALVRTARAESRLIVTRDHGLASRPGVQAILLHSRQIEQQLMELRGQIGEPQPPATPRCMLCNIPLEELPSESARGRVPPYVWRTVCEFTACPRCRRVYWQGTHWQGIRRRLEQIDR
jgi:hypothetical protein